MKSQPSAKEPIKSRAAAFGMLLAACAALAMPADAAEPSSPISEAETALFLTNYLKDLPPPTTLRYSFRKSGTLERGFDDTAEVMIQRAKDRDGNSVSAKFLTGSRKLELPPVEFAEGNPVLLYFLERDIREMKRLTGAKNQNYFQKRIRLALAERAEVRQVSIDYDGRQVVAREIRISPYLDDPNKEKFERYAGKYYLFTLSNEVPGGVYRVQAVIPAPATATEAGQKDPLMDEVLTFTGRSSGQAARKK